jgi:hypothetical protein
MKRQKLELSLTQAFYRAKMALDRSKKALVSLPKLLWQSKISLKMRGVDNVIGA